MKTKTKQNKTNATPEKAVMTSANQTPGGHKFRPLVASQQGRANQHEPACFGLSSPWSFPSRSGIPLHAVASLIVFSAPTHFAIKCSAPCSAVLRHSPSFWAAVVHWSALTSKALRSSRKHPMHSFSWPPPYRTRALHHFSEHHALRQSRFLHARHKSRKQDLPSA